MTESDLNGCARLFVQKREDLSREDRSVQAGESPLKMQIDELISERERDNKMENKFRSLTRTKKKVIITLSFLNSINYSILSAVCFQQFFVRSTSQPALRAQFERAVILLESCPVFTRLKNNRESNHSNHLENSI